MKYAEITTVVEPTLYRAFVNFMYIEGCEPFFTNDDKIIINFEDDNSVYEIKDTNNAQPIESTFFSEYEDVYREALIYKNKNYVYVTPIFDSELKRKLNFTPIFKGYTKYNSKGVMSSMYNMILTCNKKDAFAIVKIKGSERYLLAYDETLLDKDDVIQMTNFIFKKFILFINNI